MADEQLTNIEQHLAALEALVTNHITSVYTRLDSINTRLDTMNVRLDSTSKNSVGWNTKTISAVVVAIAALLGYKLV